MQMVPLLRRHPNVQVLNLRGIPAGASLLQWDLPELTRQNSIKLLRRISLSGMSCSASPFLRFLVG